MCVRMIPDTAVEELVKNGFAVAPSVVTRNTVETLLSEGRSLVWLKAKSPIGRRRIKQDYSFVSKFNEQSHYLVVAQNLRWALNELFSAHRQDPAQDELAFEWMRLQRYPVESIGLRRHRDFDCKEVIAILVLEDGGYLGIHKYAWWPWSCKKIYCYPGDLILLRAKRFMGRYRATAHSVGGIRKKQRMTFTLRCLDVKQ